MNRFVSFAIGLLLSFIVGVTLAVACQEGDQFTLNGKIEDLEQPSDYPQKALTGDLAWEWSDGWPEYWGWGIFPQKTVSIKKSCVVSGVGGPGHPPAGCVKGRRFVAGGRLIANELLNWLNETTGYFLLEATTISCR